MPTLDSKAAPAELVAATTGLAAQLDRLRLEADTHLHVRKENNLLIPAVLETERTLAAR